MSQVDDGIAVPDAIDRMGTARELALTLAGAHSLVAARHPNRIAAKLLDTIFASVPAGVLVWMVWLAVERELPGPSVAILWCLLTGCALFLLSVMSEGFGNATPGKKVFGLQVVTVQGLRVSLLQATGRHLPFLFLIAPLDALFMYFTAHRQRLAELMTQTRVVHRA
ncbi:MAG: RDD family protein [Gemmatimonadales bacterium]|nr:RDD family protein [Gemmatimonadales bacterium]